MKVAESVSFSPVKAGVFMEDPPRDYCQDMPPGGYKRHTSHCSRYVRCLSKTTFVIMSCPEGLLFDNLSKTCNFAGAVECNVRKSTQINNVTPPEPHQPSEGPRVERNGAQTGTIEVVPAVTQSVQFAGDTLNPAEVESLFIVERMPLRGYSQNTKLNFGTAAIPDSRNYYVKKAGG